MSNVRIVRRFLGATLPSALALLLLAVLIPACSTRSMPSAAETFDAKAAVDSLWSGYARASDRKDAAAFGALFAEDATLVYSNAATVRGREAIQKFLAGLYAGIDPIGLSVTAEETRVSGHLAVQSGAFTERYFEKGSPRAEYGRFVVVAERGPDRTWRIRRMVAFADSIR
jgi:uncharacterized protein (TIGR02246 family)